MVWFLCLFLPALLATFCAYTLRGEKLSRLIWNNFFKQYTFFVCGINILVLLSLVYLFKDGQAVLATGEARIDFVLKYLLLACGIGLVLAGLSVVLHQNIFCRLKPDSRQNVNSKRTRKEWFKRLGFILLIFFAALLWTSSNWLLANFGLLNPSELIFHLKVPLEGTNQDYYASYFSGPFFQSVLLTSGAVLLTGNIFRRDIHFIVKIFEWKRDWIISPLYRLRKSATWLAAILLVCSLGFNLYRLNFQEFVSYAFADSSLIEEVYVSPKDVDLNFPEQKRNLLYIYVESLESTYFSSDLGGAEEVNLLQNLTGLAEEGTHFSNNEKFGGAYQIAGTSWTVGGMVSQTTGLPLNIPISNNAYDEFDQFMPGATALGDILAEQGYKQTLLIGSQAKFAGRDKYFSQHGNYEICDYDYAVENGQIPDGYTIGWGFEDEKLYPLAQSKLTELAKDGQPFNLTMLTVDTHAPDGYLCESCPTEYDEQYANVIACADRQLVDFIRWVQEQDFYENTTIVIAGDHLSMDVDYFEKAINPQYDRRTFNLIVNSLTPAEHTVNRKFGEFDLFPTTLAALGVTIPGDRLGIGTNLYAGTPTLFEERGYQEAQVELEKNSSYYNRTFLYPSQNK